MQNPYVPSTVRNAKADRGNWLLLIVAIALFHASIPFLYGCYLALSVLFQDRPAVGSGNDGTPFIIGLIFAFAIAPIFGIVAGLAGLTICVMLNPLRPFRPTLPGGE